MVEKINRIEEYAKINNIPIIQKEGIEFINKYIKENNVKNILEIGSAIGYSAIMMALNCEDVKVTTIERDKDRYDLALKNISDFNLENRIEIHNIDAFMYEDDRSYDMIFIDAAKAQYIKFFEKFETNLKVNGVIISDNLKFHGLVDHIENTKNRNTIQLVNKIKKYISFLENNTKFKTNFYNLGDGISISFKL